MSVLIFCACAGVDNNHDQVSRSPLQGSREKDLFVVPLLIRDIDEIVPLGNLNPPSHTFPTSHQYLYLADPEKQVPVFSPADITVDFIQEMDHITDGFTDYTIRFTVRNGLKGMFGHLSAVSDELEAAIENAYIIREEEYSTGGRQYAQRYYRLSTTVSAGTPIGKAGGNRGQYALDFGLYDSSVEHNFADNSRFKQEDYIHAVSFMDYYDSALQETLVRFIQRSVEPIGGRICYDISGTAQGIWFFQGSPSNPEDPHLALVPDNKDPSVEVFSIGRSIPGMAPGIYTFTPSAGNKTSIFNVKFASTRADAEIYEYSNLRFHKNRIHGIILVQLPDPHHLKIEYIENRENGPRQFTSNAVTFER